MRRRIEDTTSATSSHLGRVQSRGTHVDRRQRNRKSYRRCQQRQQQRRGQMVGLLWQRYMRQFFAYLDCKRRRHYLYRA
jgi:hypothetical protein